MSDLHNPTPLFNSKHEVSDVLDQSNFAFQSPSYQSQFSTPFQFASIKKSPDSFQQPNKTGIPTPVVLTQTPSDDSPYPDLQQPFGSRSPPRSEETSPAMSKVYRRASLPSTLFSSDVSDASLSAPSTNLNMIDENCLSSVPQHHRSTSSFQDLDQASVSVSMDRLFGQQLAQPNEIYPSPAVSHTPRGDAYNQSSMLHNPLHFSSHGDMKSTFSTDMPNFDDTSQTPNESVILGSPSPSAHASSDKPKADYPCTHPGCGKVFQRNHNLKSHLLTHSDEKPFKCNKCDMSFRRNHDLRRHYRLHSGVKPYICQRCDKRFSRSDALRRHIKVEACVSGVILPLTTPTPQMVANMSSVAAAAAASASAAMHHNYGTSQPQQQLNRHGPPSALNHPLSGVNALMSDRRGSFLMPGNAYHAPSKPHHVYENNHAPSNFTSSIPQQSYYPSASTSLMPPGTNPPNISSMSHTYLKRTPDPPSIPSAMQTYAPYPSKQQQCTAYNNQPQSPVGNFNIGMQQHHPQLNSVNQPTPSPTRSAYNMSHRSMYAPSSHPQQHHHHYLPSSNTGHTVMSTNK